MEGLIGIGPHLYVMASARRSEGGEDQWTIGAYLRNWEDLDDEKRSTAWKEMDAGLKSYVRDDLGYGDAWTEWTYTPEEWNQMGADEQLATWAALPTYEKAFLAENPAYESKA